MSDQKKDQEQQMAFREEKQQELMDIEQELKDFEQFDYESGDAGPPQMLVMERQEFIIAAEPRLRPGFAETPSEDLTLQESSAPLTDLLKTAEGDDSHVNKRRRIDLEEVARAEAIAHHVVSPIIQNIVSSVYTGCPLNLMKIAIKGSNVIYDKRQDAVFMRIRNPQAEAKILSSGRVECRGAKSEADSRLAARKVARIIQKLGFNVKFLNFKIKNIIATYDTEFQICIECVPIWFKNFRRQN
ncbi:TATA-box-binding protein-like [Artemia franciscana]